MSPSYDPPPPLQHPPSPSVSSTGDTQDSGRLKKRDNLLNGREGGGGGLSKVIRQRESLVLHKSFNTLWVPGTSHHPLDNIAKFSTSMAPREKMLTDMEGEGVEPIFPPTTEKPGLIKFFLLHAPNRPHLYAYWSSMT